jgi:hypothetical protein
MNIYSILTDAYLVAETTAFISSLLPKRLLMPLHLRLFSMLLGLTVLVEFFANFAIKPLHLKRNDIVYTPFMLIEFMVYACFFYMILTGKRIKRLIIVYMCLFPLFWCFAVFKVFGFTGWNSYVFILGAVATICMAVIYYYQQFTSPDLVRLDRTPEFWIATGLIIFYTINLPYFGMLNYLVHNYKDVAVFFLIVSKILTILMYSLFAYAYLCQKKITFGKF